MYKQRQERQFPTPEQLITKINEVLISEEKTIKSSIVNEVGTMQSKIENNQLNNEYKDDILSISLNGSLLSRLKTKDKSSETKINNESAQNFEYKEEDLKIDSNESKYKNKKKSDIFC